MLVCDVICTASQEFNIFVNHVEFSARLSVEYSTMNRHGALSVSYTV